MRRKSLRKAKEELADLVFTYGPTIAFALQGEANTMKAIGDYRTCAELRELATQINYACIDIGRAMSKQRGSDSGTNNGVKDS